MKKNFNYIMKIYIGIFILLIMFFTINLSVANATDIYVAKINSTMFSDYEEAWEEAMASGEELLMIANWEISGVLTVDENKTVNLNMNGYMINRGRTSTTSSGQVFLAKKSSTLNITGGGNREHKGLILSTGVWSSNENGLHVIYGSLITGGYNSNGGGAIHILENASVTLNKVTVAGNETSDSSGGGAIRLHGNNSRLSLYDSAVMYNRSSKGGGGGIRVEGVDAYTLISNTQIMHNLTSDSNADGGAILVNNGRVVVSNNSEISYNTSASHGGAVYVDKGNFVINDSSINISYNSADKKGGAIYVDDIAGEVVLSGSFVGNSSKEEGGAIYVNHDNATLIKDAKFLANIAYINGGAVYVDTDDFISLEGIISMNGNTPNGLYLTNTGNFSKIELEEGSVVGFDTSFEISESNPLNIGIINAPYFESNRVGYVIEETNLHGIYFVKEVVDADLDTYTVGGHTFKLRMGSFTYKGRDNGNLKAKYYYSDGYFYDSPTLYNEHLATLSINFTLSAMATDFGDRDYSEEVAAENAIDLLGKLGFTNIFIHYPDPKFYGINEEIISTIGYIIGSKTITINNENITLIAVAVRGAGYGSEWASNVIIGDGIGEAKGFSDAASQVEKGIYEYLNTYGIDTSQSKFWLTGFSRSAATANLVSKRLTDKYGTERVYSYCFETPKGGTLTQVERGSDYSNIHNIVNKNDVVPLIATTEMGFIRYGVDHLIPANNVGSDVYENQKKNMLSQLSVLNDAIAFDDSFQCATLEYFWSYIGSSNLISEIDWDYDNAADFLSFFIKDVQKRSFTDKSKDNEYNFESANWLGYRHFYATYKWYLKYSDDDLKIVSFGTAPSDYKGNESSYIVLTFEEAVANLVGMFFDMSDEQKSSITSNLDMDSLKEELSMFDIWTEVIDEWEHMSLKNKNNWLIKIWNALKIDKVSDDTISSKDKKTLKESAYVVLDLLLDIVAEDYEHNDQNGIGTLIYNISNILLTHYQDVVAAWVRTYDSFYSVDYVAPPNEPTTNIVPGIYNESLDIQLSAVDGAKIYYTLDGTKPVIGSENTFEYNGSINLSLVESNIEMYVINAFTVLNGVKSEVTTLYYYISDTNDFTTEFTVLDVTYGNPLSINVESKFGDVIYLYSDTLDGQFSSVKPTMPGTYYVKAFVDGSIYYQRIETEVKTFNINKIEIDLSDLKWNEDSFIYDGMNKSVVLNGMDLDSNLIGITYDENEGLDAGNYTTTANISLLNSEIYVLVNVPNLTHNWEIKVAENEFIEAVSISDWEYSKTASKPSASAKFGEVIFIYSDAIDGEYNSDVLTDAGTYYVKAFVLGSNNYTYLESEPVEFKILKTTNEFTTIPTILGWEYGEVNSTPEGKAKFGDVIFVYSDTIDGEYSNIIPTMPGRYYLKGYVVDTINYDKLESEPVEFEIQKNTNKFTVELTIHNYMYGEGANAKVESLYGEATILYSSTVDGEYTTTIPVDVGTYFAKAIVLETAYYTGVESEPISFEVIKAENKFEGQVDISSWIYGETTSIPDALSKFGDIIFMYSKSIDGEYSETVPVNAGVYYLKVMVLETDNYAGLETIIEFKIEKANPVVTVPSDLTVIKGEKLSSVKLPSNWQWNEPEMVLKSEGKIQAKATYTPEDSDNYNVIEMSIEILVKPNHTILISVTSIIAITTTIGIIIIVKKSKNKKK